MKKILSGILAAALALTLGVSTMADSAYLTDVTPGSWYYGPVSEMGNSGVINGYEDNTFRPDRTVTVVELVTMVARITGAPYGEADGFWGGLQMDHAYRSGWISVVKVEDETVWLTIDQMSELFGKARSTINEHILNIFSEGELLKPESVRKIGNSDFSTKPTNYYNPVSYTHLYTTDCS